MKIESMVKAYEYFTGKASKIARIITFILLGFGVYYSHPDSFRFGLIVLSLDLIQYVLLGFGWWIILQWFRVKHKEELNLEEFDPPRPFVADLLVMLGFVFWGAKVILALIGVLSLI